MPHVRVVPIRVREYSEALGVDCVHVVGYRAKQGDEWQGPSRRTVAEARSDARDRRAELLDRALFVVTPRPLPRPPKW